MTLETVFNFIGIILYIGWAAFGMLCALRWWQERKARALTANMVNAAIVQLKDAHLADIKAEAWEQAIDTAYAHHLTEEQRDHLITLNPHKQTSE